MDMLDLLLQTTDPVVALMLIGLTAYIRKVNQSLRRDVRGVRDRVKRVEGVHIPDGGEVLDDVEE